MGETQFSVDYLKKAWKYLEELDEDAKKKILSTISKATETKDSKFFTKVRNEIWEFRAKDSSGKWHRILAFWDKDRDATVVCTHGFAKQKNKLPEQEIKTAKAIMKEFYRK